MVDRLAGLAEMSIDVSFWLLVDGGGEGGHKLNSKMFL